jgi:hypothetical protein
LVARSRDFAESGGGGNSAVEQKGNPMTIADLCLLLGVIIAFATLVVKVIEVSRK